MEEKNTAYIILIIIFSLHKKMCQVYTNCMQSKTKIVIEN